MSKTDIEEVALDATYRTKLMWWDVKNLSDIAVMARQTGRNMMSRIAAMLAMGPTARPPSVTLSAPSHHWPMPNQRNSTAAADKRCARRRRNIAKRRG